jgi:hypothetical protein
MIMPNIWDFIRTRKQIRKRDRLWELWVFNGRGWVRVAQSTSWARVMWMATGEESFRPPNEHFIPTVAWLS